MGYESETDTFFYLSGIEGEDLSFMSFSYYPQDTQKDCNYLGKVRINLLPLPDSDFTLILPSCKVIICLHKLSPIPEPDVFYLLFFNTLKFIRLHFNISFWQKSKAS
jgi:hypothetical protein